MINDRLITFFDPTLSEIIPPTKLRKMAMIIGDVKIEENWDVFNP